MKPFNKAHFPIWDLSISERFIYCKSEALKFGLKLTNEQAKQYYNEMYNCEVWKNDLYEVRVFRGSQADWLVHEKLWQGSMDYLSIKRIDKKAIHDWRHLQLIKNELVSEHREAIELYPRESRLMDTANQYHLFVFPKDYTIPLGWVKRSVNYESHEGGLNKSGQRGF
jgi:hypothetical protein